MESLCFASETNIMLHVSYMSIFKKEKKISRNRSSIFYFVYLNAPAFHSPLETSAVQRQQAAFTTGPRRLGDLCPQCCDINLISKYIMNSHPSCPETVGLWPQYLRELGIESHSSMCSPTVAVFWDKGIWRTQVYFHSPL